MTSFSTIFAAAMMMMIIMFISVPTAEAQTTCVNKLIPCYSFLNTTAKPSEECCESIKEAVENELACLCTVYNTPGLLSGFNVSTPQALGLSLRCDVTTDTSSCLTAGTPSPKASLTPPGKGKNTGIGNTISGYGVTAVILVLISTIFI